jgi:predicted CoA-binding protein
MTEYNTLEYSNETLYDILNNVKTIALVGASPKPERASYEVMAFLQARNYRIIPVNPVIAGQTLLGEVVYASLDDIPISFDMVEIFRNSEAAGEITKEVLSLDTSKQPNVIWMQLNVINKEAAALAESKGITVIMDRCPKQLINKKQATHKELVS